MSEETIRQWYNSMGFPQTVPGETNFYPANAVWEKLPGLRDWLESEYLTIETWELASCFNEWGDIDVLTNPASEEHYYIDVWKRARAELTHLKRLNQCFENISRLDLVPDDRKYAFGRDKIITEMRLKAAELRTDPLLMGDEEALRRAARECKLIWELKDCIAHAQHHISVIRELKDTQEHRLNESMLDVGEIYQIGPPTNVYEISELIEDPTTVSTEICPICQSTFGEDPESVQLPCSHLAHPDCLDIWCNSLAERCNTCPICRYELFERRPRRVYDYFNVSMARYRDEEIRRLGDQINLTEKESEDLSELLGQLDQDEVSNALGR